MSLAKKIIVSTFETVKDMAKDGAKQIEETVGPKALVEAAFGTKKNEFTDYLQNLSDPNLTTEQLVQKQKEAEEKDKEEMENVRKMLSTTPEHMKLPRKEKELRPYEELMKEEEEKKARAVEAQKKQQQQSMPAPQGKQARGSLFARRKKMNKGFEGLTKDTKSG